MAMLAYYSPVIHSCPCGMMGGHTSLCRCVVKLNRETITLFQLNKFCDIAIVEISQYLRKDSGLFQTPLQPSE